MRIKDFKVDKCYNKSLIEETFKNKKKIILFNQRQINKFLAKNVECNQDIYIFERITYNMYGENVEKYQLKEITKFDKLKQKAENLKQNVEFKKKYKEGQRQKMTTVSNSPIRNRQLANDYKEHCRKLNGNGKIWCEICHKWENIEGMLEVHHKMEISTYEDNDKQYSTFDDVILLCPNCHKLIHLLKDVEKVKDMYK